MRATASIISLVITFSMFAQAQTTQPTTKPVIVVEGDGFPSGHDTPEGAACDLARAFIQLDDVLFRQTCIRLYADGNGPSDYARFFEQTAKSMQVSKTSKNQKGPKKIAKVFAARHLSKDGPASYGYAAFGFQDVMFVDVGVILNDGGHFLNGTPVIQDKDGRWYVHPMPDVSPLLCEGLNHEAPSEQDFSEVYELRK